MWKKFLLGLFGVTPEFYEKLRNLAIVLATVCALLLTVVNPIFALPLTILKILTVLTGIFTGVGITAQSVNHTTTDINNKKDE